MTGLVVRTGLSVRLVRTSIEATVLAVGWLLGGTVGVGTVLYAFGIGPLVQLVLRITPKRVLAVSGWASVAEASDLGAQTDARRTRARRNRQPGESATLRDSDSADGHGRICWRAMRSRWPLIRAAILGIAGSPGAGQVDARRRCLSPASGRRMGDDWVAHVPMDGFHLADAQLDRIGARGRKGAPDTFDAAGYAQLLERVKREIDDPVYVPGFDRALEQPLAAALVVLPTARLVVTEGNYLLLDDPRLGARTSRNGRRVVRGERGGHAGRAAGRAPRPNSARHPMRHAPGSRPPTSETPNWWRHARQGRPRHRQRRRRMGPRSAIACLTPQNATLSSTARWSGARFPKEMQPTPTC